jgi:hypothetical protein
MVAKGLVLRGRITRFRDHHPLKSYMRVVLLFTAQHAVSESVARDPKVEWQATHIFTIELGGLWVLVR